MKNPLYYAKLSQVSFTDSPNPTKAQQSRELAEATERFLASGGQICQAARGECLDWKPGMFSEKAIEIRINKARANEYGRAA